MLALGIIVILLGVVAIIVNLAENNPRYWRLLPCKFGVSIVCIMSCNVGLLIITQGNEVYQVVSFM